MAPCIRLLTVAGSVSLAASLAVVVSMAVNIRVSLVPPRSVFEKALEDLSWIKTVDLMKCCKYGEQLNSTLNCVRRPGFDISEDKAVKRIYIHDASKHYWTPKIFYNKSLNVFYGYLHEPFTSVRGRPTIITQEELNDSRSNIFYVHRVLIINDFRIPGNEYCADVYDGQGVALLYFPCSNVQSCLRKCCRYQQELISSPMGVQCKDRVFKHQLYHDVFKKNSFLPDLTYQLCEHDSFKVLEKNFTSESRFNHFAQLSMPFPFPEDSFFDRETCLDEMRHNYLPNELVLGACLRSIGGWRVLWHLSQPSCIVAALMLALALVSVALQPSLRSSNHGRALACHAASLLLLNLLHFYFRYIARLPKMWQVRKEEFSDTHSLLMHSRITAYLIYFCLHAANCWLSVLCFNTAMGLRRMRRAPATENTGRGRSSEFVFYCSFGWGAPCILTSLVVYLLEMSQINEEIRDQWANSFIVPNLLETRTSFFTKYGNELAGGILNNGSFYYYFLPAGAVLVMNLALFLYIFLLRRAKEQANSERQDVHVNAAHVSARMYIGLLLTTSVLEAAVEIGTQIGFNNLPLADILPFEELRYRICQYEALVNIIDVMRALVIFLLTALNRCLLQMRRTPASTLVDMERIVQRRADLEAETVEMRVLNAEPEEHLAERVAFTPTAPPVTDSDTKSTTYVGASTSASPAANSTSPTGTTATKHTLPTS